MTVSPFKPSVGRLVYRGSKAGTLEASIGANVQQSMKQIADNFKGFINHLTEQSAEILKDALEPTFEKSQQIVPYDTGALHDSGFLEVEQRASGAQVVMGYAAGGNPDYAVIVHEDLEAHHEYPTQAKFLQQPLEEDADAIQKRLIEGYRIAAGVEE